MLAKPKTPRLLITAKGRSEVSGACAACGRIFHAYVRTCEKDAIVRLSRNFKLHLRLAHAQVPDKTESHITVESPLLRTG
jgi:hypothetical protein